MKVQIEIDGTTEEIEFEVDSLTLQEACDVEALIGQEGWDQLVKPDEPIRPQAFRAVAWAKLRRKHPDLDIEAFDVPWFDDSDE